MISMTDLEIDIRRSILTYENFVKLTSESCSLMVEDLWDLRAYTFLFGSISFENKNKKFSTNEI